MKTGFLALLLIPMLSFGQYSDPNVAKPLTDYGSDGIYTVATTAFENPYFTGHDIVIYHPQEITTPVPTVFYSHAYGGNNPAYISGLTDFVAKKGYAFVFVPYQTTGVTVPDRYENLLEGFKKAARDYPSIIDTTHVGFMGHSFGGGASFGNSFNCFTNYNWGSSGRFIYASAQWYSYNISQSDLQNFPSDVKLITEIYGNDSINDHRMAADIFSNIGISLTEKDFLILQADTLNGYIYPADHNTPNTTIALNAHDYYGIYRLLDALMDYTWNGVTAAKDVCLGNGSATQLTLPGGLKPLLQTDAPLIYRPQSSYEFPCDSSINQRVNYCSSVTEITETTMSFTTSPNPSDGMYFISSDHYFTIHDVVGIDGKSVQFELQQTDVTTQKLSLFAESGVYYVKTDFGTIRLLKEE